MASSPACWEETTKEEDDRCPMTNAARRSSAAHHLPALACFSVSRINLEDWETILISIAIKALC